MSQARSPDIEALLRPLPDRHKLALQWFLDHADSIQPWPKPQEDEILVATRAKGIYKPRWSDYALSVREVPGQYPDAVPVVNPDGSWRYTYHQENLDPDARDMEYTNRALMACYHDRVPVGAMRQVSPKPQVRYHILGLALIEDWVKGFFTLAGLTPLSLPP